MSEPLWRIVGTEWVVPPESGRRAAVAWVPDVGMMPEPGSEWAVNMVRDMAGETVALRPTGPFVTVDPDDPNAAYWTLAAILNAHAETSGWPNIEPLGAEIPPGADA